MCTHGPDSPLYVLRTIAIRRTQIQLVNVKQGHAQITLSALILNIKIAIDLYQTLKL